LEAFQPAYKAAAAQVQHVLGDLEATWQSSEKRQLLLAQPHGALLSLLQDNHTSLASEHTIAYTIQAWADHQKQQQQQYPSLEQLQQLVHQIRMRHCSQLYISTVMIEMPAIEPCFTKAEWLRACAIGRRSVGCRDCKNCIGRGETCLECGYGPGYASETDWILGNPEDHLVAKYAAWKLMPRPRSLQHADAVEVDWEVMVNALADMVDLANARDHDDDEPRLLRGPFEIWAGRDIQIVAGAGFADSCCTGFVLQGPSSGVCAAACEVTMKVAPDGVMGPEGCDLRVVSPSMRLRADFFVGGLDKVFQCGVVSSGLEAHRKLRRLGMVQDDECLHMRFKLREIIM
jgi:hypothetical protein